MEPALFHSVPDFTGDLLYLSRMAATTDKDVFRLIYYGYWHILWGVIRLRVLF